MTATYLAVAATEPTGTPNAINMTIRPEPWTADALCAQVGGDDWFPEGKGKQYLNAKKICDQCDVAAQCLEYALRMNERQGIYAGTTPRQRKSMRRAAKLASTQGDQA